MPPGMIIDVLDLSPLLQHPPEVDTQHLLIGEREVHKGTEALAVNPSLFTVVLANELVKRYQLDFPIPCLSPQLLEW